MRQGHQGRSKQTGAFFGGVRQSIMHPGHHTRTAMHDRTITTTLRTGRHSHVDKQQLHPGGPNSEHDNGQASNTTIHQLHRYRNPTTKRPHTN